MKRRLLLVGRAQIVCAEKAASAQVDRVRLSSSQQEQI